MKKLILSILVSLIMCSNAYARHGYHHHHHSAGWGVPVGIAIGALVATASYNSTYYYPYRYQSPYYEYYFPPRVIQRDPKIIYHQPYVYETVIIDPYTGEKTRYIKVY